MITFGGGKHRCIGMAFGFLQVRAVVDYILRNFELRLLSNDAQPDFSGFVVGPKKPCLVHYRRRRRKESFAVPGERNADAAAHFSGPVEGASP